MNYLWAALIAVVGIFLFPAAVARVVVGGLWSQVALAYAIWFMLLIAVLGVSGSASVIEKFNWIALSATILSIVAIPVLTLILRAAGWAATRPH